MAIQQDPLLDALYCEEERWEDEEDDAGEVLQVESKNASFSSSSPLFVAKQDLFWEDEELLSLFCKEQKQKTHRNLYSGETDGALFLARDEAVKWMLKVHSHHGFTALTAVLSINYLDRFLSTIQFHQDKPWAIQIAAVACLSLAAKIEETQVPLLLELQVQETILFKPKDVQKMELLVLSSLQWKMHPVTPLSFLDHIIRRLGLKTHLHWEFLRRCENLLLSVVADTRSVRSLPSVLATTTMIHVIDQIDPFHSIDYQNQLLNLLKITQEQLSECHELILDHSKPRKRKRGEISVPTSPSGVIDAMFNSDSSNDSWEVDSQTESVFKRSRGGGGAEQGMNLAPPPPLLNRIFVDILGSPP